MARRLCAWARACAARTISLQCLAINHLLVAVSMQGSAPPRRPFVPLLSPSLSVPPRGLAPARARHDNVDSLAPWSWCVVLVSPAPHPRDDLPASEEEEDGPRQTRSDRAAAEATIRRRAPYISILMITFCPHVTKKNRDLTAVVAECDRRKTRERSRSKR